MKPFSTTDIVLAAALKVLGYRLMSIDKMNNKGTFFFDGVSDEVLGDYDIGKILVEPVAFNNAIKSLTTAARRG